jgi:hypothetical protein
VSIEELKYGRGAVYPVDCQQRNNEAIRGQLYDWAIANAQVLSILIRAIGVQSFQILSFARPPHAQRAQVR